MLYSRNDTACSHIPPSLSTVDGDTNPDVMTEGGDAMKRFPSNEQPSSVVTRRDPLGDMPAGSGLDSVTNLIKFSKKISDDVTHRVFPILRDNPLKGRRRRLGNLRTLAPKTNGSNNKSRVSDAKMDRGLGGYTIPKLSCPSPISPQLSVCPPSVPPLSQAKMTNSAAKSNPKRTQKCSKRPSAPRFKVENGYAARRRHNRAKSNGPSQPPVISDRTRSASSSSAFSQSAQLPKVMTNFTLNGDFKKPAVFTPIESLSQIACSESCEPTDTFDPPEVNTCNTVDPKVSTADSEFDTPNAFEPYDPMDTFDAFDPKLNTGNTFKPTLDALDVNTSSSPTEPEYQNSPHSPSSDCTISSPIDPIVIIRQVLDRYFDQGIITNRQFKRILERASKKVQQGITKTPIVDKKKVVKLVSEYVQAYKTVIP